MAKAAKIDVSLLKKMMDPKSTGDLGLFIEKLPQHAGQTVLIAAGISWAMAGALGLYDSIQTRSLTELRAKLLEAEALTPIVPVIKDQPIDPNEVKAFIDKITPSYEGLSFQPNGSTIIITSDSTTNFAKFREAIGQIQNGGSGWRVSLDKMCVGRECDAKTSLAVALKVNKVSVEKPDAAAAK